MKKLLYLVPLFLLLLVGCGSKIEGDKTVYKEIKDEFLKEAKEYDSEKNGKYISSKGLDKNNLDDMPLVIYKIDGDYAVIFDSPQEERVYFGYLPDKKSILLSVDNDKVDDEIKTLKPVYKQNNFE